MQTIRPQQIETFEQQQEASFLDRLVRFLHQHFPESAQEPQDAFRQTLKTLAQQSEAWGLTNEDEIARYCITAWLLGVDFVEEFPVASEILGNTGMIAEERSTRLLDWATEIFRILEHGE